MSEQKDTEIILGTGKLLAIFFGLVAICGTFFGLGYSLGRTASPMALQSGPATVVSGPGTKPVAGVTLTTPAAVAEPPATNANAPEDSQPAPNPSADAATVDHTTDNAGQTPTARPAAQTSTAESATTRTATPELQGGSITVQVAAVTKQEDAQALVAALRKKNYPVFVSPNASSDNLYHVQVGPFAEIKDAEEMKSKLAGDGYNAIVKR
jgi:cell division septation protein DedD